MKALVIGGAGFVGPYLMRHLSQDLSYDTVVTKLPHETLDAEKCEVRDMDLLDADAVLHLLQEVRPDMIFHLAAQSSVALSWKKPQLTAEINIIGTMNLLEAVRQLEKQPRVLLIGSGEEYGYVRPENCPITEDTPLRPANFYAATKAAAESMAAVYTRAYGTWIACVRAFNHIGAGQTPQFVVADFCKQAVEIEYGLHEPVILTGNLAPKRDFTDVRDVVRAYGTILRGGKSGAIYNVGSGHAVTVFEVLQEIQRLCTVPFTISTDAAKLRPTDLPIIEADITKLTRDTGWRPQIPLRDTLADTLAYWRKVLRPTAE